MIKNKYYCYLIISKNLTYIGITNNLIKRLTCHNNKKVKSTRKSKYWMYHTVVGEFNNKSEAQSFEWYWKHFKNKKGKWIKNKSGIDNKMKRLLQLLFIKKNNRIHLIKISEINKKLR